LREFLSYCGHFFLGHHSGTGERLAKMAGPYSVCPKS